MKHHIIKILYLFIGVTLCFSAIGQNSGIQKTDISAAVRAITSEPALAQALVGICIRTEDGETIAQVDPNTMIAPASNMKLLTTGAALHILGPDHTFETTLAYDGHIEDGILNGNLHIIGNGDPTLASKDSIAIPVERTFAVWERMIRDAGIKRIDGHIIGDGRSFEGPAEEPTWLWNDIGTYYGAGVTGLMFYENMQSFSVSAGTSVGDDVNIRPHYPECPWMDFRYSCTTGQAGTRYAYAVTRLRITDPA